MRRFGYMRVCLYKKKIIFCIVIVYNIYMSGYVPVYYIYSMIMQRNNSVLSYV